MSRKISNGKLKVYDESGNIVRNPISRNYSLTVAGGAGLATVYLTSDGLTKGVSNTFRFSNVRNVIAGTNTIQTTPEGPVLGGWSYNSSTGLLTTKFMESKTTSVLLGGTVEGLEAEENGTVIKVIVFGD